MPQAAVGPSPLLFAAAILAGMYAAVAAAFTRNFHLTTYKDSSKWVLVLTWPVLALFSAAYREQFVAALRGQGLLKAQEQQQEGR